MVVGSLGFVEEELRIKFMGSNEICGHNKGFSHKATVKKKTKVMGKEGTGR